MNDSFDGQVALVTGAAAGMGFATAKAFAEAGGGGPRRREPRRRSAGTDELVQAGHKALAVRCNVAEDIDVSAMVEKTVAAFGRLDAAFNNAGVQSPAVETADAAHSLS